MATDMDELEAKPLMTDGPLPIPYTAEEVGKTFAELLETFDFALELHELGIGRLSLFTRRAVKKQMTALCIALWHVALEKSFPNDAATFFAHFCESYPPLTGERRGAKKLRGLVSHYDALVSEKKDGDFTKVSNSILESLAVSPAEHPKLQLKLSLRVRAIYDLIFEKLI